ncbi:hypothetical protein QBC37DRAFT_345941 [Rhypophila decipiens]|uniref:Large ribosomal subunit protein mL50 n=1 Tax=Rhypophila decipiens TaxID=261697 RepID=A0AAN6YAI1_9PEZI|nr:hypothetical protein QBC37DRAFT_345941 [Rhypophila decipiens]
MRRLPRLRGPASALSSSTSCLRTPLAATCSSTSTTPQHTSAPAVRSTHVWQNNLQRRCLSTSISRCDKQAQTTTPVATEEIPSTPAIAEEQPAELEEENSYYGDEIEESTSSKPQIETDLVYPGERVEAQVAEEITDADYVPAELGTGLEEVGGFQDWWDRPGHWGESKKYVGFGPLEKVTDFAVMEVLTRRAVIEALAIREHGKQNQKHASERARAYHKRQVRAALRALVGGEEVLGIQQVDLVAGEGSPVGVKDVGQLEAVWNSLIGNKDSSNRVPEAPVIEHNEAMDLIKAWGTEWKKATVQDPVLRFYIAKRLQRLTGHVIADAKIHGASITIGGIISAMARKPKPKKLAELLDKTGVLADLPNVQVYPRRVTPIDKEQMVGRWKLIKKELEARDLPVTGHDAKHSKTVEWKWARGES